MQHTRTHTDTKKANKQNTLKQLKSLSLLKFQSVSVPNLISQIYPLI